MGRLALDQGRSKDGRTALIRELAKRPGYNVLVAMAAFAHTEAGEYEDAAQIVDELAASDFKPVTLAATSTTFAYLADAVTALADVPRAARIYELYAPYAGLAAVPGTLGSHCAGAVDRYLGQLASTLGRLDEVQQHYEAALVLEDGLRSPPLLARTRYWYGRMLVERGRTGDADRAENLLRATLASADELGMARLAIQASALL